MSPHKRIQMLSIRRCSDPQRWYFDMVGKNVPALGVDLVSGWKSKEPTGYTNFILKEDAEPVVSLVPEYLLGRWPYITPDTLAAPWVGNPKAPLPPKTCADSCESMGICQALEDCKDKARIDAELGRKGAKPGAPPKGPPNRKITEGVKIHGESAPTPTGQSRTHSMAETMANIAVGFAASMVIQALVLPAMGHDITLAQNFWITCIFTVASVVRGYALRRIFNRFQPKVTP
jgi:hypothetical protein